MPSRSLQEVRYFVETTRIRLGRFGEPTPVCETGIVWAPTVSVPDREAPVALESTRMAMTALPMPDASLVTANQGSLLDAVHAQSAAAVMLTTALLRPASPTEIDPGDNETVHAGSAACVTETDVPAMVTTADRGVEFVFGLAVSV